jgi:UDP-2,3-diacylglucosamine hydrolase
MIYFLSDAHLGSLAISDGRAHLERLISLLDEMSKDATSIFFLGDMFDFWMEYYSLDRSKHRFRPFFDKLKELSHKGISLIYFTGEHDQWTIGDLEKLTGAEIVESPCSVHRNGKLLYVGHGDGIYPVNKEKYYPSRIRAEIAGEMRRYRLFRNHHLQLLFRMLPPALGNKIGYRKAKRKMENELSHPVPFRGKYKEHLLLFAKEHEGLGYHHDYYIFGHRHIALDMPVTDNSRVLLLGDCFRQWTYAALDENGQLELRTF